MSRRNIFATLKGLQLLRFFPASEEIMDALVDEVMSMAASEDQVKWLVKRMLSLYAEWPGPGEMRAVFCNRYKPKDGISAYSSVYPDGIPSEKPEPPALLALPAGHKVSTDPILEAAICALAEAKDLNRIRPRRRVPDVPEIEVPPERRITQADVDLEVERLREKRARQELEEQSNVQHPAT
jgi:hypothetical protein